MDMAKQDWDLRIEGSGLELAMQQWEARPKASKPIDKEWRTRVGQGLGQKASTVSAAEPVNDANGGETDPDEDNDEESAAESEKEDEFAQLPMSQEEEDAMPWDEAVHEEEKQDSSAHVHVGSRRIHSSHMKGNPQRGEQNEEQSVTQECTVAKRKRTADDRHRRRDMKRAYIVTTGKSISYQRPLQLIVGEGLVSRTHDSSVPWEHRCILGQTRG
jgi:hypothetical protein